MNLCVGKMRIVLCISVRTLLIRIPACLHFIRGRQYSQILTDIYNVTKVDALLIGDRIRSLQPSFVCRLFRSYAHTTDKDVHCSTVLYPQMKTV